MADLMLRISAKGTDTTAKAVASDNQGNLITNDISAERNQLVTAISVLANSFVEYEVPLSKILSSTQAVLQYSRFDLSWFSVDGIGGIGTEVHIYYHRLTGDRTVSSLNFHQKLSLENGIKAGESGTFFLNSDEAQSLRNNFITVKFVNNTAVNKGLYYPTLILKK